MGATSSISLPQRWRGAPACCAWLCAAWLCAAAPAHADPLRTVWWCWLHEAQNLACMPVLAPQPAARRPAHTAVAVALAVPGGLRHRLLYIPLHNVPFDDGFVAELAQSVLCGRQSGCETRYRPELAQLVALAPADFVDAHDPVLADAGN